MQKKVNQIMKVYIFKIFNTVNKLYKESFYFTETEAVSELIYLDRHLGKGIHEIHKIHYTTIQVLEDD